MRGRAAPQVPHTLPLSYPVSTIRKKPNMSVAGLIQNALRVTAPGQGDEARHRRFTGTRLKRSAIGVALFTLLGLATAAGRQYWDVGRFVETTDDAYVQADSTIIAPKVSGYIAEVLVGDNQSVHAGEVLARIDDRDFRAALDEAIATVAAQKASVANLDAQIAAQDSAIKEADAQVSAANASLALAQRNDTRRQKMAQVGYGSDEQADEASTDAKEKVAIYQRLEAAAAGARQQQDVLNAQRQLAQAQLAHAQAAQQQATLNLGYTAIVAPVDGTVAARSLRQGQYVQAGTQLMAIVPLARVYVVANFKETQLTDIEPGQTAQIAVDTFPGDEIDGKVDSLAPASGLEFSLLPPDNATGNFTKIVQRIPVKLVFAANDPLLGKLRPGMSVDVSIDTRSSGRAMATAGHGE
jgi:membrane fusion protein (multidrug efflux system)